MAKILCIGDPHLKITRFDLACQFLSWVNSVIVETNPDIVVNLGDTFDTHAVIRSEIQGKFKEHIDQVLSLGSTKYIYLLGNHDMFKPDNSKFHALQSFKSANPNFIVVDKLMDIDGMTFVPYMSDHTKFPTDTNEICFAHQTFVGADYGYIRPEVGVLAENVKAEVIISGHVHLKQEFGKVIYPGSPYSQSVNDTDQVKGLMLFDTATYKKQFIECPLPKWKRLTYEVSPSLSLDDIHNDLSGAVNSTDHWIVCITGPKAEVLAYINSKKFNVIQKTSDITIKPTFSDKEKKLKKIEAVSLNKIMEEYVDNVYTGSLDRGTLKTKIAEIISEVNKL